MPNERVSKIHGFLMSQGVSDIPQDVNEFEQGLTPERAQKIHKFLLDEGITDIPKSADEFTSGLGVKKKEQAQLQNSPLVTSPYAPQGLPKVAPQPTTPSVKSGIDIIGSVQSEKQKAKASNVLGFDINKSPEENLQNLQQTKEKIGFFEGLQKGYEGRELAQEVFGVVSNPENDDKVKLDYLENKYKELSKQATERDQDIGGYLGELIGGQIIPIAKTAGAGVAGSLFTPIAGVGAGVAVGAADASSTGYGSAFLDTYSKARAQGFSKEASYEKAKKVALAGGIGGAVEGGAGAFVGGKGVVGAVKDVAVDATLAGLSQLGQNIVTQQQGIEQELSEGIKENMTGEVVFSLMMRALGLGASLPKVIKAVNQSSASPDVKQEAINQTIDTVENGKNEEMGGVESRPQIRQENEGGQPEGQGSRQEDAIQVGQEEVLINEQPQEAEQVQGTDIGIGEEGLQQGIEQQDSGQDRNGEVRQAEVPADGTEGQTEEVTQEQVPTAPSNEGSALNTAFQDVESTAKALERVGEDDIKKIADLPTISGGTVKPSPVDSGRVALTKNEYDAIFSDLDNKENELKQNIIEDVKQREIQLRLEQGKLDKLKRIYEEEQLVSQSDVDAINKQQEKVNSIKEQLSLQNKKRDSVDFQLSEYAVAKYPNVFELKDSYPFYRTKGSFKVLRNKSISEAYHKAKADGSNPELVKAVEDLLSKQEPLNQNQNATQESIQQQQEVSPESGVSEYTGTDTGQQEVGQREGGERQGTPTQADSGDSNISSEEKTLRALALKQSEKEFTAKNKGQFESEQDARKFYYDTRNGKAGTFFKKEGRKVSRKLNSIAAERAQGKQGSESFNLFDRTNQIMSDLGLRMRENFVPAKAQGVFKTREAEGRVRSFYDAFIVAHESVHAINMENKTVEKIDKSQDEQLKKQLLAAYKDLYSPKTKGVPKDVLFEEGLSSVAEFYLQDPEYIKSKYPKVLDVLIDPNNRFHNPKYAQLIEQMSRLVEDYAGLDPIEQIKARIADGEKIVKKKTTNAPIAQQAIKFLFDSLNDVSVVEENNGVAYTDDSSIRWSYIARRARDIAQSLVSGNTKFSLVTIGGVIESTDKTSDYITPLAKKGKLKDFDAWLVSRRVVADFEKLKMLKNDLDMATLELQSNPQSKELQNKVVEAQTKYNDQFKLVENDQFDADQVNTVYNAFKNEFSAYAKIYDRINQILIDVMEKTQLISKQQADEFRAEKSYAKFARFVNDDLLQGSQVSTLGNPDAKVTSLRSRTGSSKELISPSYSQILSISETVTKGLKNQVWVTVANATAQNPEFANLFVKVLGTGDQRQTQDVWINGEKTKFLADPVWEELSDVMDFQQVDTIIQGATKVSKFISRGTTGVNFLALPAMFVLDVSSAAFNTKTGLIPVVDQLRAIKQLGVYKMAKLAEEGKFDKIPTIKKYLDSQKEKSKLVEDYLAQTGQSQNYLSDIKNMNKTIEEVADMKLKQWEELTGSEKARRSVDKIGSVTDKVLDFMAMPINVSEFSSRFAEYSRAIKRGDSPAAALEYAENVTTNFSRKGKLGGDASSQVANTIIYLRSSLAGFYTTAKSVKENPQRAAIVISSASLGGLALAALAFAYGDDEDKDWLAKQQVENFSRYVYIPAALVGGKGYIKLRVTEFMGVFTGLGYMMMIEGYKNYGFKTEDYINHATAFIPKQLNPIVPALYGKTTDERLKNVGVWAFSSFTPTPSKTATELAFEVKTYPRVQPMIPPYMKNVLPKEQYDKYTTAWARELGAYTGISPIKIDYFAKSLGTMPAIISGNRDATFNVYSNSDRDIMRGRIFEDFWSNKSFVEMQYTTEKRRFERGESQMSEEEWNDLSDQRSGYEFYYNEIKDINEQTKNGVVYSQEAMSAFYQGVNALNMGDNATAMQQLTIFDELKPKP